MGIETVCKCDRCEKVIEPMPESSTLLKNTDKKRVVYLCKDCTAIYDSWLDRFLQC